MVNYFKLDRMGYLTLREEDYMEKDSEMSTAETGQINKGSAYAVAAASLLLPGLGQLLNKQKTKALIWFLVPVVLFTIEITTSD